MYSYFYEYVQELLGYEYGGVLLLAGGLLSFMVLIIIVNPVWRARLSDVSANKNKLSAILCYSYTALKYMLCAVVLIIICAMLHVQSGLMSERQGQVTQKNYDAVKTKWGIAHELRQLGVNLSITEKATEETFANGSKRELLAKDNKDSLDKGEAFKLLSDETFSVERDKENKIIDPLSIARRKVFLRRRILPGNAVTKSEITFDIKYNPRYLGGAGYAGYSYNATLIYTIENNNFSSTWVNYSFMLPGKGYGVYNDLKVEQFNPDESQYDAMDINYSNGTISGSFMMNGHSEQILKITYKSRGLEYLRYTPGNFLKSCKAKMNIAGFDAKRLNFPIGAMTPQTDLKKLKGEKFSLEWDLSNAVTNYSIGIIVPAPTQPGFAAGNILRQAPLGMLLLAIYLCISRYFIQQKTNLLSIGMTLLMSYLGYALFAHLSDSTTSFYSALLLSLLLTGIITGLFWLLHDRFNFCGIQSMLISIFFCTVYPLAVYHKAFCGIILNCAYIILTFYMMMLWVVYRKKGHLEEPQQ